MAGIRLTGLEVAAAPAKSRIQGVHALLANVWRADTCRKPRRMRLASGEILLVRVAAPGDDEM